MDIRHLSNFELRQICYFLAVVEAGNNFSRAAEYLHIEQPPLSQRVRSLERSIGVELFDRRTRPIKLTPAGEVFHEGVTLALSQLQRAIEQSRQASRGEIGRLDIGVNSGICNSLLPSILQSFRQQFPQVQLFLHELTSQEQVQLIRDSQIDVGFEQIPNLHQQEADLCFVSLLENNLVIALPENHPLASQSEIPLEALVDENFIVPSFKNASSLHTDTITLCRKAGFTPKITQEATWMITVLSLVAGGIGVSLLNSNVRNLQRVGVVYRDIAGENSHRQIAIVWCKDRENSSPTLREFLRVAQSIVADIT